jgi:radical SAM-linked protein
VDRPSDAASEARQRWRITYARDVVDADAVGRAAIDAWGEALTLSGLPVTRATADDRRPRVAFAAPLPAAARGERELLDLWLLERLPAWRVRASLEPSLPDAHHWVDAEDVWLGAPALAGQLAAADWRIELDAPDDDAARDRLTRAVDELAAATSIPRVRTKGTTEKTYDLRPLLLDLRLEPASGSSVELRARTGFDSALGAGRPDEVVAAVADAAGLSLEIRSMTRMQLLLADQLHRSPHPEAPATRPTAPGRWAARQPRDATSARPGRN